VTCSTSCSASSSWSTGTLLNTSGAFDILTAPHTSSGDGFLGDYDGLAPTGTGFSTFGSAFVMAQPIATSGRTDLFFNTGP
jgi:hypothetical protein